MGLKWRPEIHVHDIVDNNVKKNDNRSKQMLKFVHLFSFLTLIVINISPGKKTTYIFILTNILFLLGYRVLKFGMTFLSHFVIHLLFLVININWEITSIITSLNQVELNFFFSLQTLFFITFCTLLLILLLCLFCFICSNNSLYVVIVCLFSVNFVLINFLFSL